MTHNMSHYFAYGDSLFASKKSGVSLDDYEAAKPRAK